MFVRISKTPNSPRVAVKVVESFREGYKVKQRLLQHIGIAHSEEEVAKLKRLGEEFIAVEQLRREQATGQLTLMPAHSVPERMSKNELAKKLKKEKISRQAELLTPLEENEGPTLGSLVEEARVIDGIHEIFEPIFNYIGAPSILQSKKDQQILKDLVFLRIAEPCSKYKTRDILMKKFGSEHDLDAIYRMMDKLHAKIPRIKELVFTATQKLNRGEVDVLFYDCTTLYFESINEDELRKFGFSKDHRFNTTQLVLALASDQDGLPVGYELFPGNTAEVKTLIASLDSWSQKFFIKSVCFVADRAMMSDGNLKLMEEKGYSYIVAAKLRALSQVMRSQILDGKNYFIKELNGDLSWLASFSSNNRRLVVSYNASRARHDAKCREEILEKIKKKMTFGDNTKNFVNNQGVKKYTTMDSGKTQLSEEKITADAAWDGFHGVITNIKDKSESKILERYHRLWKIEECFRLNKTNLAIRPIFHFKPERIEAHIAICYLAFSILRFAEYQANLTQKISPQELVRELLSVQSSILIDTKTQEKYRLPSRMSRKATQIYRAFYIKRAQKPMKISP